MRKGESKMLAEKIERDVYDITQKIGVLFSSSEFWENARFFVFCAVSTAILFYAVQIKNKLDLFEVSVENSIITVREDIKTQTHDITSYTKKRQLKTQRSLEQINKVTLDDDTGNVISKN